MGQLITVVDAFTETPFAGNPAAVCVLPGPAPEGWMRAVAREMNLSETGFTFPEGQAADGPWRLRWFTPTVEVDLCGHATLATAHVLWERGLIEAGRVAEFETRSGRLSARRDGELIELDFPAVRPEPAPAPAELAEALRAEIVAAGTNRMDWLVELADEGAVLDLEPDLRALKRLPVRGVIATARGAEPGIDFVSRFFAPAAGVDEDPVTGSAHCALGPYWGAILGKTEMMGRQVSARGGLVRVRLAGDRVLLGGRAVTILRGELAGGASRGGG
jgi:PhzF family phenazine biosynthesis protein